MACIIVPTTGAVLVYIATKIIAKKKQYKTIKGEGISLVTKLTWLYKLLFGGGIILAFKHLWHGEIVLYFPFLTALQNPRDTAQMITEMTTVGTTMLMLVILVWALMCIVVDILLHRGAQLGTNKGGE